MTERYAGVLIPLFSIRSADDFGRGEFAGLLPMGQFALQMGHRLIQLLPIDEVATGESSPYSALSVFALDPLYLSIALLPGIAASSCAAARAELQRGQAQQVRIRARKNELLAQSYRYFQASGDRKLRDEYQRFASEHRPWLDDYALFRALSQEFGGTSWETWPPPLKSRQPQALANAALKLADNIAMHKYVQFLAHRQWDAVHESLRAAGVMLGGDLAFSPCRESVEVWANQDLFDLQRSVGAPPDAFARFGQRWGLPMPSWERMRARSFDFLRMRVRHARQLFDLLRIDHVVGLFRTWGYALGDEFGGEFDPLGESAQRAQGEEILRLVLEQAGPMKIVAEDLGVIPQFVRDTLAAFGIPGYKVMRWETEKSSAAGPGGSNPPAQYINPARYPAVSLATTGTHDTETMVEWWAAIGEPERIRLAQALGIGGRVNCTRATLDETTLDAILEALYASPARLVVTPIQDLFAWNVRINLPGTISEANWSWRLPFELERIGDNRTLHERQVKLRVLCERTSRFPLQSNSEG